MARGRPRAKIDKNTFEGLCAIQCTELEICAFFGITEKTLSAWCKREYDGRNFSQVFAEKRGVGRISLRRSQFQLAKKNATMAIWLGKQYLGQTDKVEETKRFDTSQFEQIVRAANTFSTEMDDDAGDPME